MHSLGVVLLVFLCVWTGYATMAMFSWRRTALGWKEVYLLTKKTADISQRQVDELINICRQVMPKDQNDRPRS